MSNEKRLPPIHPGKFLMEEFLEPMGISQYRLAQAISVPPSTIPATLFHNWLQAKTRQDQIYPTN